MTLERFLERDRQAIATDVRPATLDEYRFAAQHAIATLGADATLDQIDRADVGRIKQQLSDRGRSRATISKTCGYLRAAFNRGVTDGLIVSNPFQASTRGKIPSRRKRIFTIEEIEAMLAACPTRWWRLFLRLAFETGCRRNELLHLTYADIDVEKFAVGVSAKRTGTFQVNGRSYPILEWSSKTAQDRVIPTLTDETISFVEEHRQLGDGSAYLFLSLDRLAFITAKQMAGTLHHRFVPVNNLRRDFHKIQQQARILLASQQDVTPDEIEWPIGSLHDARRTFCTRTADLVPMHVLQQWAGHANISTTASFYLVVSDAHAQRVRAAFANANGKPDVNADVIPILSAIDRPQVDSKPPSRYRNAS